MHHFRKLGWQGFACIYRYIWILVTIALVCFLTEEYVTFGMWDAKQFQTLIDCSEEYYNFAPGVHPGELLGDQLLMRQCAAIDDDNNDTTSPGSLSFCDKPANFTPSVMTKCGRVASSLISERTIHRTEACHDTLVPNVVHYISLGEWEFSFLNYLSFRSVDLFQKPTYIFIHGDGLPYGPWWQRTLSEVANIYHVKRKRPLRIQGRKIRWLEHATDVLRLQTILDNGGIYLDTDILLVKSLDPLRGYEVTLGRETSYGLGSGIIIAKRHAPFVCVWFNVFRGYNPFPWNWAYYAVHTPDRISKVLPKWVHIEDETLHKPSWQEAELLFKKCIDWSKSYAVHVWKRFGCVPESPAEIKSLNTTLGDIMRFIYFTTS